jgi:hypothetical protein
MTVVCLYSCYVLMRPLQESQPRDCGFSQHLHENTELWFLKYWNCLFNRPCTLSFIPSQFITILSFNATQSLNKPQISSMNWWYYLPKLTTTLCIRKIHAILIHKSHCTPTVLKRKFVVVTFRLNPDNDIGAA